MFPLLTLNLYDDKYKRETLINEGLPYLKYIGRRVKKCQEGVPFERVTSSTRGIFYRFIIPINCVGVLGRIYRTECITVLWTVKSSTSQKVVGKYLYKTCG